MALTTQPQAAGPSKTLTRTALPQLHGKEVASASWKAGAFIIDETNGLFTESTSAIDGTATVGKRALGIALADARGVTGADFPYVSLLVPDVLIEITLSDLSAGTHTLAQADLFKTYAITKGTANWYLDANAASDKGGGTVVEFVDPVGTVDGRVLCRLTRNVIGPSDASSFLSDEGGAATYTRGIG